jgi:Icc-related predicted phosphoesterase
VRLVLTSDTHGLLPPDLILPPGEMLIHAGDATMMGRLDEVRAFAKWMRRQPHLHKLYVPGNHDFAFELNSPNHDIALAFMADAGVTVLIDSLVTIQGLRIYGMPWTPTFGRWAFMRDKSGMERACAQIPDRLDILITHGPPYGILDRNGEGERCGSGALLERIKDTAPRLNVHGHIHPGHGMEMRYGTAFFNVAACDDRRQYVNPATVYDLEPKAKPRSRTA